MSVCEVGGRISTGGACSFLRWQLTFDKRVLRILSFPSLAKNLAFRTEIKNFGFFLSFVEICRIVAPKLYFEQKIKILNFRGKQCLNTTAGKENFIKKNLSCQKSLKACSNMQQ